MSRREHYAQQGLPSGYRLVQYLQSDGTQYINTGIYPDNTYTFDTVVGAVKNSFNCVYWGVRSSGNTLTIGRQCFLNSNTSSSSPSPFARNINLYSTNVNYTTNWSSGIVPVINTLYTFSNITVVSEMNLMTLPITLFAFNNLGNINTVNGECRIGLFKAMSNGDPVIHLVSVADSNNIGYMYDYVSGTIFSKATGNNFIIGPDL